MTDESWTRLSRDDLRESRSREFLDPPGEDPPDEPIPIDPPGDSPAQQEDEQ
jgi:hypothetical protein